MDKYVGTMGLADMLIKLGITYGSENALRITEEVYRTIAVTAICVIRIN